jgi:hypothetical protein
MDSWPQLPSPVSWVCHKAHTQCVPLADQPQRSPVVSCASADISQVYAVHYPPTSYRLSKYHTVCRSLLGFATGCPLKKLRRIHSNDDPNSSKGVDLDPNSSEGVDSSSSKGVDTMLTQTRAKLPSVLVPNVCCRRVIRLP